MADLLNFIQPIEVLMNRRSRAVAWLFAFVFLAVSPARFVLPRQTPSPASLIPVTFVPLSPFDDSAPSHVVFSTPVEGPVFPPLSRFVASVTSPGDGIVGVYVPDLMAHRVVPQPGENSGFVAALPDTITQFAPATEFGAIGLLAHNNLAGANFERLFPGETVSIVYGDGTTREFQVTTIRQFQALSPNDPYSDFLDLDEAGRLLSSTDLFNLEYTQKDTVVFQTCIAKGASPSWGRLFVMANAVAQN